MTKKVVMGLSGGMDSSTMLVKLLQIGYEVSCIGFTYGSKHNQYENIAAESIAKYYGVEYQLLDLTVAFSAIQSNLLKTGGDIPEGHYEQDNMSLTVVPGRNTIFAGILLGKAESIDASYVALGVHQGDHTIYPDCRIEYIKALDTLLYLASDYKVEVITPFLETNKIGILEFGFKHDFPYHLTRTCYKDQELSCGICGSCNERIEAFANHGIKDPVGYENTPDWNILYNKFRKA